MVRDIGRRRRRRPRGICERVMHPFVKSTIVSSLPRLPVCLRVVYLSDLTSKVCLFSKMKCFQLKKIFSFSLTINLSIYQNITKFLKENILLILVQTLRRDWNIFIRITILKEKRNMRDIMAEKLFCILKNRL